MKPLALGLALLFVVGLHVAWWPDITTATQPAFTLAFVIAWGMVFSVRDGFWLALTSGLVLDLYTQQRFGTFMFATLLAYAVILAYLGRRGADPTPGFATGLFVGAAALYELTVLTSYTLFTPNFPFFTQLGQVATLNLLGSAVAFAVTYALLATLRTRTTSPHERSLQY